MTFSTFLYFDRICYNADSITDIILSGRDMLSWFHKFSYPVDLMKPSKITGKGTKGVTKQQSGKSHFIHNLNIFSKFFLYFRHIGMLQLWSKKEFC